MRVLELERDLDPDEYVKEAGADAYRGKLESAPAYFHWLADRARKQFDMRTVEGRLQAFKFVSPAIQRITDRLERFAVANDVAHYLGVDEKLVREHFSKGSAAAPERRRPSRRAPLPERLLLKSLIASEEARMQAIPQLRRRPGARPLRDEKHFPGFIFNAGGRPAVPLCRPGGPSGGGRPGPIVC